MSFTFNYREAEALPPAKLAPKKGHACGEPLRKEVAPDLFAKSANAFASSHLSIAADGTWSNADGRIVDAEFAYEQKIAPMLEITNAHQVGFRPMNLAWLV